ncbi:MAG: CPBP family intramembrane metalloprotease [Clostridiales bacterium]|nr:CPBP family intramembrane metalloprotease [Clostridiales bacterium]
MKLAIKINKLELTALILSLLAITILPPYGILIAFGLVILVLFIGKEKKQKLKSIGFTRPKNWGKTILICVLLAIAIEMSFEILFNPIIERLIVSKIDSTGLDNIRGNLSNYLIWLLLGWIIGGFIEEILFRGFLITRISSLFSSENSGNLFAIVLTSTIFGFNHLYQGWSGVISTGLIGVLFGIIFIKNNKILWYSILTHGFVNVIGFTVIFLDIDNYISNLILK